MHDWGRVFRILGDGHLALRVADRSPIELSTVLAALRLDPCVGYLPVCGWALAFLAWANILGINSAALLLVGLSCKKCVDIALVNEHSTCVYKSRYPREKVHILILFEIGRRIVMQTPQHS